MSNFTEKDKNLSLPSDFNFIFDKENKINSKLAEHRAWLKSAEKETPRPDEYYKVAVYIRYYNQTKHSNYLDYHKKQFLDTVSLCPNWEFIDFYIDEGSSPPHMEYAPNWARLLEDCYLGKVNLIITQKTSNISKKQSELAFCARILAAFEKPVGIYFVSENIFTLASYYREDLHDYGFLPNSDYVLIDEETEVKTSG